MQRVFGLYFNPSESSPLADPDVRRAVDVAIDRDMLAESVFSGYARPTRTPLPFDNSEIDPEEASDPRELLEDAGWEVNSATGIREKDGEPLAFTIKTGELEELVSTASYIEATLRSLGFDVTVETFDIATLNETVIRGRDYDALLFGQAYGRFIDLYPFWHSSNRNDPGLNIARYTSSSMDEKLVGLRRATEEEEREEYLNEIVEVLRETIPAVFLYVPDFLYITDERIKNIEIPPVERSSNRFSNVEDWFMYTDTVWKIFLKDQ
jgi:peptide/nickel transport system substrate-binding protein